jgi:molecular chaperone Hsp33
MAEAESSNVPEGVKVPCSFVRKRNALLVRADFEALYVDYYLHLADRGIRYDKEPDQLMKDALAAMTLHCAARPWKEATAWTMNLQSPLLNIFVAGDNHYGAVVGQLFTQDVKEGQQNMLYVKVVGERTPLRTSVVDFEGKDIFRAVEHYYRQSEQRPARYFQVGEEEFVMICAQPNCDLLWLEQLDAKQIGSLHEKEEIQLLETRYYKWQCGCNQDRIYEILIPTMESDPNLLFEGEETIRISCPRCGVRYLVTREALEAFMSKKKK